MSGRGRTCVLRILSFHGVSYRRDRLDARSPQLHLSMTAFILNRIRVISSGGCVALVALLLLVAPSRLTAASEKPSLAAAMTSGRVLVLGDSITQNGQYVSFLEYELKRHSPKASTDVISIGLSSETVSGLTEPGHPFPRPCVIERLDRALKAVAPKVVFACYGMNDGIYHPPSLERRAAFQQGLNQLISRVRAAGARLVLVTPPVFDALPIRARTVPLTTPAFGYTAPYVDYDGVLAEFAATARALNATDVTVIDLHTAMRAAIHQRRTQDMAFTYATDGVHPNDAGHLLIARTILQGLGYPEGSADADAELKRTLADPLFALVKERRELRSETWLAYVGYQKGGGFKSDSVKAAERAAARLQVEIDAVAAR